MSTYWDVYCMTCQENYGFPNANHADEFLLNLVDNAEAIAAFPPLGKYEYVEITTPYGHIDPEKFRKHLGHDVVVKSEYGDIKRGFRNCSNPCSDYSHVNSCYRNTVLESIKGLILVNRMGASK